MQILVPISAGELVDKITILRLKRANLQGAAQTNVVRELEALEAVAAGLPRLAGHEKLVVWGARDFCFDDGFLSRWREIYPDARVERLEGAGHYVLEDAGERAVAPIRDFLTHT